MSRHLSLLALLLAPLFSSAAVEECTEERFETFAPATVCFGPGYGLELAEGASVITFPDAQIDTTAEGFSFRARSIVGAKGIVPESYEIVSQRAFLMEVEQDESQTLVAGLFDGQLRTLDDDDMAKALRLQNEADGFLIVKVTFSSGQAFGSLVIDYEVPEPGLDYGDAPEPYPTTMAGGGASHLVRESFALDTLVDEDADGEPAAFALGSEADFSASFDEVLVAGTTGRFRITPFETPTVPVDGYLSIWIDFNRDGVWAPDDELVLSNMLTGTPSSKSLDVMFPVPEDAVPGISYARLRFADEPLTPPVPTGASPTFGEVEDFAVLISDGGRDLGDYARNQASALIVPGFQFGDDVDGEDTLVTDAFAASDDLDGEDDEDGFILVGGAIAEYQFVEGGTHGLLLDIQGGELARVTAWVDADGDRTFEDSERLIGPETIRSGRTLYAFKFQEGVEFRDGSAGLRLRMSPANAPIPAPGNEPGEAIAGEVEDYRVKVLRRVFCSGMEDRPAPPQPVVGNDDDDPLELGDEECIQ